MLKMKQNEHVDNEEHFAQEEVECGYSTGSRVSTPDSTNKK